MRMLVTLPLCVAALLVFVGCTTTTSPAPRPTPEQVAGTATTPLAPSSAGKRPEVTGSPVVVPTVTPDMPTASLPAPTAVPPAPPAADVSAVVFTDPVVVASRWWEQSCPSDYRDALHTSVQRAAVFQTPRGAAADLVTADTEQTYRQVREQKIVVRCDGFTATVSPEAPSTQDLVYVVLTARRVLAVDERPFQSEDRQQVRRVVRGADGRWLVDVTVGAG